MLKFVTIENDKKKLDSNVIDKNLQLKYFFTNVANQYIDTKILKTYNSLLIVSSFEKQIPKDIRYLKRVISELKFLQTNSCIELLFTLKSVTKYLNKENIFLKTTFNTFLISYLMGITKYDPINYHINLSEIKEKLINFEIEVSDLNKTLITEIKNNVKNNKYIDIHFIIPKQIESDNKNIYILDKKNSFFREFKTNKTISSKKIIKKSNDIDKIININVIINYNSLLYIYNQLPKFELKNILLFDNINFIGIPLIENRINIIYCKYKNSINNYKDIYNILNLSANTDIKLLFNKINIFHENFNISYSKFDELIEYIKMLTDCSTVEAKLYYESFHNNKEYMKELFVENLKDKGMKKKDINSVSNKLIKSKLFEKDFNIDLISVSKCIFEILEFKISEPIKYFIIFLNNLGKCNLYYRKWVYFRNIINSGIDICIGNSNWKLENGKISSFYKYKDFNNDIVNFKNYGFWNSKYFLKEMYFNSKKKCANFRGLIASYEKIFIKNKYYSWVVIGYDNDCFLDIFINGEHQIDKMECIEGSGLIVENKNFKWVLVENFNNSFLI